MADARDGVGGVSRRAFGLGAIGAAVATGGVAAEPASAAAGAGRLKQSVCRWCFKASSLEELCLEARKLGLVGIDLLGPKDFAVLKQHGLVCTMVTSHPLTDGLCDPQHREASLQKIHAAIEATAAEGWRNVICFSGNARGIDRRTGLRNCAAALREIVPVAEKKNVVLNMELLNSRVDHPDYMCDTSAWGIELVKEVASGHFKLLYDIYHMQIMEGDIIRSIQQHHDCFGHFHTAGNPGRHELDDTQELHYPPIARAIAETGFDGFIAHEFIPRRDPFGGLAEAVRLCTV